jgi:hypothetical protein
MCAERARTRGSAFLLLRVWVAQKRGAGKQKRHSMCERGRGAVCSKARTGACCLPPPPPWTRRVCSRAFSLFVCGNPWRENKIDRKATRKGRGKGRGEPAQRATHKEGARLPLRKWEASSEKHDATPKKGRSATTSLIFCRCVPVKPKEGGEEGRRGRACAEGGNAQKTQEKANTRARRNHQRRGCCDDSEGAGPDGEGISASLEA